ncbi:MAG TPA: hypothetical protein DEQ14_11535 [Treponema sp.]|nr:hypothetical protein [Treponema sp.]
MESPVLSGSQAAAVLGINENTIYELVKNNHVPYLNNNGIIRFSTTSLTNWLEQGYVLNDVEMEVYIQNLKKQFEEQFPESIRVLRDLDKHYTVKRVPKGYSLSKVTSKKHGFLYYVRYIENGKLILSRWNTFTNDLATAERFARDNRERILTAYHAKKESEVKLYKILEEYYLPGSKYLQTDADRGRVFSEESRARYHSFITKTLIPYLKSRHIKNIADITPVEVTKLQDYLLEKKNKPQTINKMLCCVRLIFDFLLKRGKITSNPFRGIVSIKVSRKDRKLRGCYAIDSIRGVFNRKWPDDTNYMLCLMIYSTDMRNSEIGRVQMSDIIDIDGCHFINIPESKTENGVRVVPLHPFVYEKIMWYARKRKLENDDYLFQIVDHMCQRANADMGKMLGITPDELKVQNITFYSGRAFWKTAMSVENLGDIEEYFMGHRVSSDVAKIYNHKDKIGKANLLSKAKDVFKTLDKYLFKP